MEIDAAPTAMGVSDAAGYVERLRQLRVWAGQPSLRRLATLAGTSTNADGYVVDQLPPSTVSDVLAGKRLPRLPRMELVAAFVEACLTACSVAPDVTKKVVEQWLAQWRRLAGPKQQSDQDRIGGTGDSVGMPEYLGVQLSRRGDRPLVGRQEALRDLAHILDEVSGGRSRFVAVVGEPGAGKTRLLTELAAAAVRRGLTTLWGRPGEFEQEMPLGMVIDALDDQLEGCVQWVADRLGVEQARLLSTVLPSLWAATTDDPAIAASDRDEMVRYRTHRAIRRLLEELTDPPGMVLILDDVHWADAASVELIDHLLRHPPRGGVLVALAYRPTQLANRLTALIESDFCDVRQVPVAALSLDEVAEFLGPAASRAWCHTMHAASGGNPFYLEALASLGRRAGLRSDAAGSSEHLAGMRGLPPAVRAALEVELHNLSPTAWLAARAAAVVASEFEPTAVSVAAQVPGEVVLAGLDEMSARDIVRPAPGGRFRFRHPLVRNVAYDLAGSGWRLGAHARIAAHLEDIGAPSTVRAHHVEHSARFGDHAAVATLLEAARTVAPHAPAAAAHWLAAALRLLPADSHDPDSRLDLLLDLARLQVIAGLADGHETIREILDLLAPTDHSRRAHAIRFAIMIERHRGHLGNARRLVLDELNRTPDRQAAAAVPLHLRLVFDNLLRGDHVAARATLDLLPKGNEVREPGLAMAIAAARPLPAFADLRIADAARYLDAAVQLETAAPDEHIAEWLDAVVWLCWAETLMCRHRTAQRRFERAVAIARATGHHLEYALLTGQARTHLMLGQLVPAALLAKEVAVEAPLWGRSVSLIIALSLQCLAASWSGEHTAALRFGDQALRVSRGDDWQGVFARYAHALALINAGRLDAGAATMSEAWFSKAKLDPVTRLSACELMAYTETVRGQHHEAIKWADRAERLTHPDLEISAGLAMLARAHTLRTVAPFAAAEHARHAATVLTVAEQSIDAGRARLFASISYVDAGERYQAREQLRHASQIFAACNAHSLLARAIGLQHRID